jgi:hypothetical protein
MSYKIALVNIILLSKMKWLSSYQNNLKMIDKIILGMTIWIEVEKFTGSGALGSNCSGFWPAIKLR